MNDISIDPIRFILFSLATFRLTYLMTKEAGPFHLSILWRKSVTKKGHLDEGARCPYCTGMWISMLFTYLYFWGPRWSFYFVFFLALGGAAMLIHQAFVYLFEHS